MKLKECFSGFLVNVSSLKFVFYLILVLFLKIIISPLGIETPFSRLFLYQWILHHMLTIFNFKKYI